MIEPITTVSFGLLMFLLGSLLMHIKEK